jgi:acyl-coenzyme A synthetase/AMP-(fatty) acid ligase
MKMPQNSLISLWSTLTAAGYQSSHVVAGADASASWGALAADTDFDCRAEDFRGRTVVLATIDQLAAAVALIQLDGVARRIVLCAPDLSPEHLLFVADSASADAILTDQPERESLDPRIVLIRPNTGADAAHDVDRSAQVETQWVLLTSGTTGLPKLVVHTLASLAGAIDLSAAQPSEMVWSTFYDIRRYGGLQIFLRAALTGTPLVLSGAHEPPATFLARAGAHGVTHISGTPSHWRLALMSAAADRIHPDYVRLSGEISDQGILSQLQSQYPNARVSHAFASTEAGVAFVVDDGLMGFPASIVGQTPDVDLKVEGGTLRVRSSRTAIRYFGSGVLPLKDADGFVDTGDALDLREGRYFFVGRRDGTINVGGAKVHPEEVEAVINRHPEVSMSLVRMKKNPIMGSLVIADVVLKQPQRSVENTTRALQSDILQFCRGELAVHKVPAVINFVPALAMAETGKLIRRHA